mgnify:CR=1 FL=1
MQQIYICILSTGCGRGTFHPYIYGDGNPLPSFEGEPTWVDIEGDIDEFTDMVWENLNEDNKVCRNRTGQRSIQT